MLGRFFAIRCAATLAPLVVVVAIVAAPAYAANTPTFTETVNGTPQVSTDGTAMAKDGQPGIELDNLVIAPNGRLGGTWELVLTLTNACSAESAIEFDALPTVTDDSGDTWEFEQPTDTTAPSQCARGATVRFAAAAGRAVETGDIYVKGLAVSVGNQVPDGVYRIQSTVMCDAHCDPGPPYDATASCTSPCPSVDVVPLTPPTTGTTPTTVVPTTPSPTTVEATTSSRTTKTSKNAARTHGDARTATHLGGTHPVAANTTTTSPKPHPTGKSIAEVGGTMAALALLGGGLVLSRVRHAPPERVQLVLSRSAPAERTQPWHEVDR